MGKKGAIPILILSALILFSCGHEPHDQEYIAVVNDTPILLRDFQKEVSVTSNRDPTFKATEKTLVDLLETMVVKKLMIYEATREGVTEDEHFVETIKNFWEQTLIRQLIDKKTMEWTGRLFVTEDEIRRHYERMRYRLTVNMVDVSNEEEAIEIRDKMLKGTVPETGDILGPFFLENIRQESPIYEAFDLRTGETKVWQGKEGYVVIKVLKKDAVTLPELDEIYGRIKAYLFDQKKERVLNEWIDSVRRSASIEIDTELLKMVANEG